MIGQVAFYIFAAISFLSVVIPMIRHDHWTFRALEFPRIQKFIFVLAVFIVGVIFYVPIWYYQLVLLVMTVMLARIGYHIFPFTPLSKKTLKSTSEKSKSPDVRLMIYNVFQDNTRFDDFLGEVDKYDPDMIMMVETDQKWLDGVELLSYKYSYSILKPLDNTYGMLLFSKFEFEDDEIRYLIKDEIPSMKTKVKLNDGRSFWFFGLHPEPPSPTENEYSTARDRELMKLAEECSEMHDPIVVAGDLNDVAWSYTTTSFIKESGLLDPRKGRGFFSTFHTKSVLMRWPLDHIFCSQHFELVRMKKLKNIGSDHFPILIELMLK